MPLRIAIFGQAPFGREATEKLAEAGHQIVAVYAPPDAGRADPLGALAEERGWPAFRYKFFRRKGIAIPEIVEEYLKLGADLNVLPFTTAILPPEIIDAPQHGSLCFHPSLLPAFRGGAALTWQIILGARQTGVTVFRVTEGVDAGPIVIQRGGIAIESTDTMASLYFDKLYPMGLDALQDAVAAVDTGTAEYRVQDESHASEQGLIDDAVARIDWKRSASEIERLIRGCDPAPGALACLAEESVRCFGGGRVETASETGATPGRVLSLGEDGLHVAAGQGVVRIAKLRIGEGRKLAADACGIEPGARFS